MSKVYVLIHDQNKVQYTQTFYEEDKELFKKLNAEGWGVFVSVNEFEATEKEMAEMGVKTKRNIPFLSKINAVFADLDVAKKGDGKTREQKEAAKELLLLDLYDFCPPSRVIDTSNGIQPFWDLKDVKLGDQKQYVRVINAIIEWSMEHGAMGDKVKDVTRVLRCPGYYHMKETPYMVQSKYDDKFVYTLDELEGKFKNWIREEKEVVIKKPVGKLDDLSLAIDCLDIQEIAKRAFASIGRPADFNGKDKLVLDGRETGTFQGRKGDRGYIASSSHEPFKGNRITVVADIKQITNKEARQWLIDEFNLKKEVEVRKRKKIIEGVKIDRVGYVIDEDVRMFTWGTPALDREITPLEGGQFNLITGNTNMGKTTFSFDVAQKNAKMGHKVLYLSLEQSRQGVFNRHARSKAGITKAEWRDRKNISPNKKEKFRLAIDELLKIENLILFGFGKDIEPSLENIFATIREIKPDLVFIDNFDDIKKNHNMEYSEQTQYAQDLKVFAQDEMIPINVLHHRNAKSGSKGIGAVRGSGKITDTAWTVLKCWREWDDDASKENNAKFMVQHEKDREFGSLSIATVYWQNGTFTDNFII